MNAISIIWHELVGLFVEDGSLALAIIGVVVTAVIVALLGAKLLAGIVLLGGCLGVLTENVLRRRR